MYLRHISPILSEALTNTPVVLLNGARQTGKSTLVQSLAASGACRYLTLDDQAVLAAAKYDPAGFIDGVGDRVILDEVQRAPEIFLPIKAEVDRDRRPGRFLLTGSANVMLLPRIADSLAGRMEVLTLWPLSSAEMVGAADFNCADWLFDGEIQDRRIPPCEREQLVATLLAGGFPEAVGRGSQRRRATWFTGYLQAVLQRDVRDLANLEQLTEMPNLLQLLATRSGGLLNFAEVSRTSRLTQTTLKRYFTLLETLFLVVRLPAWDRNPGKRLVKSPKVFLPDSGLLAHLAGMTMDGLITVPGLPGGLVESYVLGELLKHLAFSDRGFTLSHYRTQTDVEVDFVLENRLGKLTGIEVKASSTVNGSDFKGLRHLQESRQGLFQRGIVLYAGREVVAFDANLFAVPLSMWWAQEKIGSGIT